MERKNPPTIKTALVILVAFHIAGIAGFLIPVTRSWFPSLTPLHLLITGGILFYFHRDWNRSFLIWMVITFLTGYLAEVTGVHTGMLFGSYSYGESMGPQILDVPVIIGVNWLLLAYLSGSSVDRLAIPVNYKIVMAALLMVLLDVAIEPFAIEYGLWSWHGGDVPLKNYFDWLLISLILQFTFYRLPFDKQNPISVVLLLIESLFFILLN